jgi:HSP20 family protein
MTFVRINPWKNFEKATNKMNQIANEFEKGFAIETSGFNPRVDLIEDEKHYYINIELPGVNKEDVKISINQENILTIKGEKKSLNNENTSFLRTERFFGSFARNFALPDNLDCEKISAKYIDGILEVSLPKVEPPLPKEIEINID